MPVKKIISSRIYYIVIVLLCVAIFFLGFRIVFKLFNDTSTNSTTAIDKDIIKKNEEIINAYLNLNSDKTELEASQVKGESISKNPSRNIENLFLKILLSSNSYMQIAYEQEQGTTKDFSIIRSSIAMILQELDLSSYIKSQFPAIINILNINEKDNSSNPGDSTAVTGSYDPDNSEVQEKGDKNIVLENIIIVEDVEDPVEADEGILIYEQSLQQLGIYISESESIYGQKIADFLGIKAIQVDRDKPFVLVYHTHGTESYYPRDVDNYHTTERPYNITNIGEIVSQTLCAKGLNTIHEDKYHDNPSYNGSYTRSLETATNILRREKNIKIIFDIHRDGVEIRNEDIEKKNKRYVDEAKRFITNINGINVARFSLVIGPENPNKEELIKFAKYIKAVSDVMYPGLCRGIIEKPYGRFNEYLSDYYALIEVGSNMNTIGEAEKSAKLISDVLDKAINGIVN